MTTSSTQFDIKEKSDILIKSAFGFPSTNEDKAWFLETAIPANSYIFGEDILVEEIPDHTTVVFDTIIQASEIGLTSSDFLNYSAASLENASILRDSTGVLLKFNKLKLIPVPQSLNQSWYRIAGDLNENQILPSGTNLLQNTLQFNYKAQGANLPYLYSAYKSDGDGLAFGQGGGNWFVDVKNGLLFFPDYPLVSSFVNEEKPPVISITKYIGKRGLSQFTTSSSTTTTSTSNTSSNGITNITQAFQTSAQSGTFIGYRSSADEIYGIDVDPSDAIVVGKSSIIGENDVVKTDVSYVDVLYNDEPSLITIKLTESPEFTETSQQYTGFFDTSFVTVTSLSGINVNDGIVIPTIDYWNAFRFDFDIAGDGWDVFKGSIIPFYLYNTFRYTETVEYNTIQYQWNYLNTTSPTVYNDLSWNYVTYTQEVPDKFSGWNVPFTIQNQNHAYSRNFIESIDTTNKRLYLKISSFSYPYTGRQLQIKIITSSEYVVATVVNYSLPYTDEDDEIITANTTQTLKNKTLVDANIVSDNIVGDNITAQTMDISGTLIAGNGNVGIGTTSPYARLHIINGNETYGYISAGTYAAGNTAAYFGLNHFGADGYIEVNSLTLSGIAIYTDDPIVTDSMIVAHTGTITASDVRIKNNITDVVDDSALTMLRALKPKTYGYKDVINRSSETVYGFIAQEVGKIIPQSVQKAQDSIPNIYQLANVGDDHKTICFYQGFDTQNLDASSNTLKIFDKETKEHFVNIEEVIDASYIRVDTDLSHITGDVDESGNIIEGNKVFVYGQRVDDFNFLKKDAIWTVATAALQEVDRQLQAEKAKVATLESQVAALLAKYPVD